MGKSVKKREVSNEEFNEAYNNQDNKKILSSIATKYRKSLDQEEIRQCSLDAIWRCLAYHKDNFKQKFTTSLWRFAHWEFQRELSKKTNQKKFSSLGNFGVASIDFCVDIDLKDSMNKISPDNKKLINQYFFEGESLRQLCIMNKCKKEIMLSKIDNAIKELKKGIE